MRKILGVLLIVTACAEKPPTKTTTCHQVKVVGVDTTWVQCMEQHMLDMQNAIDSAHMQ